MPGMSGFQYNVQYMCNQSGSAQFIIPNGFDLAQCIRRRAAEQLSPLALFESCAAYYLETDCYRRALRKATTGFHYRGAMSPVKS